VAHGGEAGVVGNGEVGVQGNGRGVGVHGKATSSAGTGVLAESTTGWAGAFVGRVYVSRDFIVLGAKSAAVAHPDGSHRALYCMESPESWFEDFGRARLARGRVFVKLEGVFAALVRLDEYHVFLTAEGDCNGLYVHRTSRSGFEVRERQGGRSDTPFSYRIVAKRKDVRGQRLARVKLPTPAKAARMRR